MLLSKVPLSRTNVVFVGDAQVPSIVANVHLPQGEIFLIGTHPVPPISSEFSNLRNNQLAELSNLIAEQKKPVLLIGDLNTSPWSVHFSRLLKESGLQNSMKHFGFQPSWPVGNRFLRIPLDHVLHSPDILIHNRAVGPDVGSDHFSVLIDFSIE
jgi:endonuclease/exonuclease/phosphatase (EEP) superfamily protein YafD